MERSFEEEKAITFGLPSLQDMTFNDEEKEDTSFNQNYKKVNRHKKTIKTNGPSFKAFKKSSISPINSKANRQKYDKKIKKGLLVGEGVSRK